MSSVKCCCCIPIEVGAKLIAAFTILGTVALSWSSFTDAEYRKVFLPIAITGAIMSLIWLFSCIHDRFWSRRLCFWGSLSLRFAFHAIWYSIVIFNGTATDYACLPESLEGYNERIEPDLSREDCKKYALPLMIFDLVTKMALSGYFTS